MGKSSLVGKNSRNQNVKPTKKTCNKISVHNFDGVDSLSCLKQKRSENIDDKFTFLKSELHSLFLNPEAKGSENLSRNHLQVNQAQNCNNYKRPQNSDISLSPDSSKVSKWLSESIEKMEGESSNLNFKKNVDCCETLPSNAKLALKSKYNMELLPNYKVERLLYKSFQLQNFGTYVLSSSDESEGEQLKASKINKQKKRKSRKASKSFSSSFPAKRKRASLDNSVEIINVAYGLKKSRNRKVHHVDLDIDSFDWNEPFYTKNSRYSSSDLEIIENDQSHDIILNKSKQNNAESDLAKTDFSTNAQEENSSENLISGDTKRTWECPICLETSKGQSIVATQCGHIFCKVCLEKHISAHGKLCPTCRLDLSDKPPITLFNM